MRDSDVCGMSKLGGWNSHWQSVFFFETAKSIEIGNRCNKNCLPVSLKMLNAKDNSSSYLIESKVLQNF